MRKGVDMINGIGSSGKSRVDLTRTDAASRGVAAPQVANVATETTGSNDRVSNRSADLAAMGAPIDTDKIAAIRAAIVEGRYPVDPKAIAEKMLALDLPVRF